MDSNDTTRIDHSIWPGLTAEDPKALRAWLAGLGFAEGIVVTDEPDAVHERAEAAGASVTRAMEEADYGSRGFSLLDPEGNSWSFGTYAG